MMDDAQAIEFIEKIERGWKRLPKGMVIEFMIKRSKTFFEIVLEVEKWWLMIGVVVGPRGGIKEGVCIIDPTEKFTCDRLKYCGMLEFGQEREGFLPIRFMRKEVRIGKDPADVCREHLERAVEKIQSDLDNQSGVIRAQINTFCTRNYFLSESIPYFVGGGFMP